MIKQPALQTSITLRSMIYKKSRQARTKITKSASIRCRRIIAENDLSRAIFVGLWESRDGFGCKDTRLHSCKAALISIICEYESTPRFVLLEC